MATQAPYWGKLPPPNVTRTSSVRRDEDPPRLSINTKGDEVPSQNSQSQSRQNRMSTQTTATTTTASTQSPFASPVASSFRGEGLAPRPTSYKYGAPYPSAQLDSNKEYLDRRRRRESRNREGFEEIGVIPPPAAPDAPRPPPPLSYKQPQAELTRSNSSRNPNGKTPEDYFGPELQIDNAKRERGEHRSGNTNGRNVRRSGTVGSRRERPEYNTAQSSQRKGSLSEAEEKRCREWAPDRSPLQRLELTLDSITKEEKRARVEEAELLLREGKSGRSGSRSNENSVRFRNRPVAVKPSDEIEPQTLPDAGLVRNVSNTHNDQLHRSGTVQRTTPSVVMPINNRKEFDHQTRNGSIDNGKQVEQTGAPQRSSSVRDRSAIAGGVAGAGLVRSGSNKLRKEPPGDLWHNMRNEAERNLKQVAPRKPSGSSGSERREGLPIAYSKPAGRTNETLDSGPEEDLGVTPMRRGSTKKVEQLTGNRAPAQNPKTALSNQQMYDKIADRSEAKDPERGQRQPGKEVRTELVTVNGIKYTVPPSLVPGDGSHGDAPRHKHDHRHLTDILHHHHDDLPGGGTYVPSRRLDEWKKASVALLSGALLNLDALPVPETNEAEKDKAWWEAGHSGKRRNSSTKPRKAEAYDGEYDNSNGTVPLLSLLQSSFE